MQPSCKERLYLLNSKLRRGLDSIKFKVRASSSYN